jgi:hypothetical protein
MTTASSDGAGLQTRNGHGFKRTAALSTSSTRIRLEIVANNRSDWIGWVELATEPITETAVEMTARVIQDVGAGVLCVVEAENRPSLDRFNQERLLDPYEHVMLIDGMARVASTLGSW